MSLYSCTNMNKSNDSFIFRVLLPLAIHWQFRRFCIWNKTILGKCWVVKSDGKSKWKKKCEIIWIKTPKGNLMHLLGNWINRLSRWIFISITNLAINTPKVLHYYKGNFTRCLRFSNIMFNAQNILSHSKMLSLLYTILETKKKTNNFKREK